LRLRRAVGLAANSKDLIWIPPDDSLAQRWTILRALALAEPGADSVGTLLRNMDKDIRSHTSIILITPSLSNDWIEALMPLMWRGVTPTTLLLDPQSFGSQQDIRPMQSLLGELGIAHYTITKDLLNLEQARPGQKGRWEWRVSGRGKAVLVRKPGDMSWRGL
jgi:uncharacterized protein (DUF58 family)